ncbi:hypothetical protein H112_02975 [Trichophyton rubrum D6]|uniref:Uncharacterized protein n=2 Tax=Trichophyton TaxID=5550 RepID=A0A022W7C1_TRIRU|nr:hypothetical protein H100_02979 [Trichophyton rubrum MR850]EZF43532.1 hypothetical protein H102_02973 [Trichophyton rubrum CBS 100081]EZF54184.1 hypothetical protein H103_02987 [Trichophyton rubrum CBS 288.86]EZF64800.1 hypothetical protein H104_02966 [Trichophyton rubrum CBS 289.86]EZF75406.1 hypothetical protein H105_02993 [Trichophyton soudanense CBS 452.61]EZF86024.1 hypothetical protein H110_02981 [Trichophyton rubrum MR1448]EZF96885.1 hypothetical protein H113_02987 [Trichophyton rub
MLDTNSFASTPSQRSTQLRTGKKNLPSTWDINNEGKLMIPPTSSYKRSPPISLERGKEVTTGNSKWI